MDDVQQGPDHAEDTDGFSSRAWLTDMDGVLVSEGRPIPGADEFVAALRSAGRPFLVLTNNSNWTARDLSARLQSMGLHILEDEIWTSALATATFLADQRHVDQLALVDGTGGGAAVQSL